MACLLLIVVTALCIAHDSAASNASEWVDLPNRRVVLTGQINDQWPVQLDLAIHGQLISGSYFYLSRGEPLDLEGKRDLKNLRTFLLTERVVPKGVYATKQLPITGRWAITPDKTGRAWTGTWTSPDEKKSYNIALKLAAEYDLSTRTVAGGSTQIEVPRPVEKSAALSKAIDALIEDELKLAKTFIYELRDWQDDPELAEHFAKHHYYFAREWRIDHIDQTIVSMHVLQSEYTGGAHPNYGFDTTTVVLKNGQDHILELKELFKPGSAWLTALQPMIIAELQRREAAWIPKPGTEDYEELLGEPALFSFTIAPHGLTFYFGPYLFGPYAQGAFICRIPWKDLTNHIDPKGPAGGWIAE